MRADDSTGTSGQDQKLVRLLSGRLLARNVAWNLLGNGLPLIVALWAVPKLIRGMGTDRFGLLSIVWMGIGYFSLFDLGTGRALTKLVAERLGGGRESELPTLIRTGLKLMLALGSAAALIVAVATPWLTGGVLKIPVNLVHEAAWSFWILAATLPFVVSTAGLVGILQAHQRFATIVAVRVPTGVMSFLGPVLALVFTPSLIATTVVLAACRFLSWLAYRWLCRDLCRGPQGGPGAARAAARELLSFGGWVTVSNVVGPLMVYCDRFVVGIMLGMTAVAYYTTPYDVITRLSVISGALVSVLFPALTMALTGNRARTGLIFSTASRVLLLGMLIPLAAIMLFAREGLRLWLDPAFAQASSPVLRWLAVGVLINSLALLPYALLQGKGRPDLTGKLHLLELPFYGLVLWIFIRRYGVVGAAASWSLRVALDAGALYVLGMIYVPEVRRVQLKTIVLTAAGALFLAALALPQGPWLKAGIALGTAVGAGGWMLRDVVMQLRRGGERGAASVQKPAG